MREELPAQGPEDDGGGAMGALARALAAAIAAMIQALILLLLVLLTVLARALQALLVLARYAALPACAVVAVYGALRLFLSVSARYGGDFFAVVLALAFVVFVPASLVVLAHSKVPLWPTLLASGALSMLAHLVVERSPPFVLALAPPAGLTACILQLAFGMKSDSDIMPEWAEEGDQNGEES